MRLSRCSVELVQLGKGSFFGEEAILRAVSTPSKQRQHHQSNGNQIKRMRTAVAVIDCNLNFLQKETVEAIAVKHPVLMQRIKVRRAVSLCYRMYCNDVSRGASILAETLTHNTTAD